VALFRHLLEVGQRNKATAVAECIGRETTALWNRDPVRLPYCLDELERCRWITEDVAPGLSLQAIDIPYGLQLGRNGQTSPADSVLIQRLKAIESKLNSAVPGEIPDPLIEYSLACCARGRLALYTGDTKAALIYTKMGLNHARKQPRRSVEQFALDLFCQTLRLHGRTELASTVARQLQVHDHPSFRTEWILDANLWNLTTEGVSS
jgi:hypothetical protein